MYNWTDGKGWCYTAYCNSSCGTEIRSQTCNQDCVFLNPPRKVFELKYVGEEKNPLLSLLSYLG